MDVPRHVHEADMHNMREEHPACATDGARRAAALPIFASGAPESGPPTLPARPRPMRRDAPPKGWARQSPPKPRRIP